MPLLRVLTYNVCATPMDFAQVVQWNAPEPWRFREGTMARRLEHYDIVGLEEMFLADAHQMRESLAFETKLVGPAGRPVGQPLSSGVELCSTLASSYAVRRHYRDRGRLWDQFAAKGALLTWLEVPHGRIAVVVTHLQSGMREDAIRLRCEQLAELRGWIDAFAEDEAVLVLGDLNIDGNSSRDPDTRVLRSTFADFHDAAALTARWRGGPAPSWDPSTNTLATDQPQRLDYILFRPSDRVHMRLRRAGLTMTDRVRGQNLSDHYGVEAEIEVDVEPLAESYLRRLAWRTSRAWAFA